MKKIIAIFISLVIFCTCSNTAGLQPAQDAFTAGREFVDGCLKGDFDKANFYMLQDNVNTLLLNKYRKDYQAHNAQLQQQYKDASIIILEENAVNDTTHIINYENSYDKIAEKVKVLQTKNGWLVDFKYTLSGNL